MSEPRRPRGRRTRISRSGDFDAAFRRGRSASDRHMVVYAFTRADAPDAPPRLGLSVSRKVGGSVERNRVKRVLREQFAQISAYLPAGLDVVVIARPGLAEEIEAHGGERVRERLSELTAKASRTDRAA